jgi:hypothetical protein
MNASRPDAHAAWIALAVLLAAVGLTGDTTMASDGKQNPDDVAAVKALFADPPRTCSSAPLWVWNDWLTEEQVVESLRDLAAHGIKQAFVHPRPGLMTPYLSEDWFRLWKAALREAERLDMNLWIYDENSYPSGFAGGFVPAAMPAARGRGLAMKEQDAPPGPTDEFVAVFRSDGESYANVTAQVRAAETLGPGRYLVFAVQRASDSPWYGGKSYVDLLYPGVTEKFIEVTLEAYRREIGDQFGQRVPGTFTDEPQICPAGALPWTDHLLEEFQTRWGYSLLDHLPALYRDVPDAARVRHNYYQVLLEQFIARWAQPMHDYCQKYNLEFTGHYWEHDWPRARFGPDNMAMYAWHQRPAIDILFNQYSEDVGAQFGNVRAVKELSSVANQLGCARTLCEAYGASGWDIRLEDLKRIGDWLYVLGVNTLDQHLSYVTIRGARKRDHPESFSYHEPWWEAYPAQAMYFTRLTAALSSGAEVNSMLVLEPTTTAWLYNVEGGNDPRLKELGDAFQALVTELSKRQIEYDIGCEDILARHGTADAGGLKVGQRTYTVLVLPPLTQNLNARTLDLFEQALARGLRVLCCGDPPSRADGQPSDRSAQLARHANWRRVDVQEAIQTLDTLPPDDFDIAQRADDQGLLFLHRRRLADGQLVFLVNTSMNAPSAGTIQSTLKSVQQLDLDSGQVIPYRFASGKVGDAPGIEAAFELPPCGSLLLLLSRETRAAAPAKSKDMTTIAPLAPPTAQRIGPNVLTIDYVDISAGGETKSSTYFYQANQFAFQKNGLPRNPWDSAVQFRDELISKTFPANSGFEATYRFTIAERVPPDLAIVIERPDLYTIMCNGKPVSAAAGDWWLDRAFGRIDIAAAAQVGDNAVTLKAMPFTMFHELESAYLLGDFALRPAERGFTIVPAETLQLGRWNEQGLPFYAAGVAYTAEFDLPATAGRYRVALSAWYGSVAKAAVNGRLAGYISAPPYELDVTPHLARGRNAIEVTVVGTLKNTLGPHHNNPPLGIAWPAMFQTGPNPGPPPGSQYATVGYGLFEPFVLKQAAQ